MLSAVSVGEASPLDGAPAYSLSVRAVCPARETWVKRAMRERHHGQKSWSERGTKGASQAANATKAKYEKLKGQL